MRVTATVNTRTPLVIDGKARSSSVLLLQKFGRKSLYVLNCRKLLINKDIEFRDEKSRNSMLLQQKDLRPIVLLFYVSDYQRSVCVEKRICYVA